jgi:hypothetical protein
MKTCNDCHHYVSVGEGKNGNGDTVQVGNCFRFPPAITVAGPSSYPVVGAVQRECGEFAAIPKRKKA